MPKYGKFEAYLADLSLSDFCHLILCCGDVHPHPSSTQGENGQPGSTLLSPECSPCAGQVSRTCPLCATEFREETALWHHLTVEHISRHSFLQQGSWRITVGMFVPHVVLFMLEGGNFVVILKALANLVVEVR